MLSLSYSHFKMDGHALFKWVLPALRQRIITFTLSKTSGK